MTRAGARFRPRAKADMRPTLRILRTGLVALFVGALTWTLVGTAFGAMSLGDGSFDVDQSAGTPTNLTPVTGTELQYPTSPVHLAWRVVPGVTGYNVQVSRQSSASANCSAAAAFQTSTLVADVAVTSSQWVPTMSSATDGESIWTGTYCWRVRSAKGTKRGLWSSPLRFTVTWPSVPSELRFYNDEDGSFPRLPTDGDYATGSAAGRDSGYLQWTAAAGAKGYDVQISTAPNFSPGNILLSTEGRTGTRLVLPQMPDEDGYYWRVRAIAPNGSVGSWVTASASFAINRFTNTWIDPSAVYPADAAPISDVRVGWTPVDGASYYEYQMVSSPGCFWDWSAGQPAPVAWGTGGEGGTSNPNKCRLSSSSADTASTLNNWVTLQGMLGADVVDNQIASCAAPTAFDICTDDDLPLGVPTYWRVRPVWQISQSTESSFTIGSSFKIYGAWLEKDTGIGQPYYSFEMERPDAGDLDVIDTTDDRCEDAAHNPTGVAHACAHLVDGSMSISDASFSSTSMQLPLLRWGAFPGRAGAPNFTANEPGGYLIQIAQDPQFNRMVVEDYQPGGTAGVLGDGDGTGLMSFGMQQSYSPPNGLPDDDDGNGYWWRVIPCQASDISNECFLSYGEGAPRHPFSPWFLNDGAQARMFGKQVEVDTAVVPNFAGSTPLLMVGANGSATAQQWAAGVAGADHYKFEISTEPTFTDSSKLQTIKTTVPRITPATIETPGESTELAAGTWYWRVAPIDRNGIQGSWSDTDAFDKAAPAPNPAVSGGGGSVGGAVVSWESVDGATSYDVQWSLDSNYSSGVSEGTTKQTAYRIPDTVAGTFYWRVRATPGGVWSASSTVTIAASTKIKAGVSRASVIAKETTALAAQLIVAGTAVNGRTVLLQRKTTGCDGTGAYTMIGSGKTGRGVDDGVVSFKQIVRQNSCYRFAYVGQDVVHYSAPISVKARPNLSFQVNKTRIKRGQAICSKIATNTPVTGRLSIQYKVGAVWYTARAVQVRGMRKRTQCASFLRAGTFQLRAVLDNMNAAAGWKQFEATTRNGSTLRVNDQFQIIR